MQTGNWAQQNHLPTWAVGSGESDRDANAPEIDAIVASRTPIVR